MIEEKFDNFLLDSKYAQNGDIKRHLEKYIVDFIKSIKAMKHEKRLFLIPIMGLKIAENFSIGSSSIVSLNDELLVDLATKYGVKLSFNHKDQTEKPTEYLQKINETTTYSVVVIEDALDVDKALELAKQKTETCLNFLRLFTSELEPPFVVRTDLKKIITERILLC
jgi:hypothetical protein